MLVIQKIKFNICVCKNGLAAQAMQQAKMTSSLCKFYRSGYKNMTSFAPQPTKFVQTNKKYKNNKKHKYKDILDEFAETITVQQNLKNEIPKMCLEPQAPTVGNQNNKTIIYTRKDLFEKRQNIQKCFKELTAYFYTYVLTIIKQSFFIVLTL